MFETENVEYPAYRMVERVIEDTCNPLSFAVVKAMIESNENTTTTDTLVDITGIPKSTLVSRLEDLAMLKILKKIKPTAPLKSDGVASKKGCPHKPWMLQPHIADLWKNCKLGIPPALIGRK